MEEKNKEALIEPAIDPLNGLKFPLPMLLETDPQDFHLFVTEREDLNAKQKLDLYEAFVKNRDFVLCQTSQVIQEHLRSAFLPLAKQQELIELFQDLTSDSSSDREFKAQMEKIPLQGADLLDNEDVIEAQKALLKKEVSLGQVESKQELIQLLESQCEIPLNGEEIKDLLAARRVVLPLLVKVQFAGQEIAIETKVERTVVLRKRKDGQGFLCFLIIEGKKAVEGEIRVDPRFVPTSKCSPPYRRWVVKGETVVTLTGKPGVDSNGKIILPHSWSYGVQVKRNFQSGLEALYANCVWILRALTTGYYEIMEDGMARSIDGSDYLEQDTGTLAEAVGDYFFDQTQDGRSIFVMRKAGRNVPALRDCVIRAGSYVFLDGVKIEGKLTIEIGKEYNPARTKEVRKFRLKQAQLKDKQGETQLQLKNEVRKVTELATEMDVKLIKAVRDHSLDSDKKVLILDYRHAEERDARAGVMPVHRQEFYRSVRRVLRYFDELAECDLQLEQVEEDMRNCSAQNEFYFNTTDVFNPYAILRVFLEEDAQIELKCFDTTKLLESEEFQLIQEFQTPLGRINLYEAQLCFNRQEGNFEFQKILQYP